MLEPFTDAPLIIVDATETVECITHPFIWPEEMFCGGQPNDTLTEEGLALLQGLLPTIRLRAQEVRGLFMGDLPHGHPSKAVAGDVLADLEIGLLILEAVAARCESGVDDASAIHSANVALKSAHERAQAHYDEARAIRAKGASDV